MHVRPRVAAAGRLHSEDWPATGCTCSQPLSAKPRAGGGAGDPSLGAVHTSLPSYLPALACPRPLPTDPAQVVVLVTDDLKVICLNHNLQKEWEEDLRVRLAGGRVNDCTGRLHRSTAPFVRCIACGRAFQRGLAEQAGIVSKRCCCVEWSQPLKPNQGRLP